MRDEPLVVAASALPEAGGYASFVGRVRRQNEGKAVTGLYYEAYRELAEAEGARILAEARRRFDVLDVRCDHRIGELEIGDAAIVVEVAAAHRREAFRACEFVVDEVKKRVPIWKHERYADGASAWVHAGSASNGSLTEPAYYERQARLPELGTFGQGRLGEARVLVVGAGGLGCPAIAYLARAGVGTIGIADGDDLDATNLHRQSLFRTRDLGRPKVDLVAEAVADANPFVRVEAHRTRLTAANADALLGRYDLVLDATDNFEAKYLLNDRCLALGLPLVQAGVYRYEGWVMVIEPAHAGGCLRCLWPEPPEGVRSCAEVGVLGVVPGLLGVAQATEAIKTILGIGEPLSDRFWMLDLLSMDCRSMRRSRRAGCSACALARPRAKPRGREPDLELAPDSPLLSEGDWRLIDLRPGKEAARRPASRWPWVEPPESDASWRPDVRYLVVCAYGVRSLDWARNARSRGLGNVWSLRNGVTGLERIGP